MAGMLRQLCYAGVPAPLAKPWNGLCLPAPVMASHLTRPPAWLPPAGGLRAAGPQRPQAGRLRPQVRVNGPGPAGRLSTCSDAGAGAARRNGLEGRVTAYLNAVADRAGDWVSLRRRRRGGGTATPLRLGIRARGAERGGWAGGWVEGRGQGRGIWRRGSQTTVGQARDQTIPMIGPSFL